MSTADAQIAEILSTYGEPLAGNVWRVQGQAVIYHKALERIAAQARITFDQPVVLRCERDEAVILVTGRMPGQNGELVQWSIGEALIGVNYRVSGKQAAYPFAMAEKRVKDRVILKLIGLHGLLYSEDESDEFKSTARANDDEPSPAPQDRDALTLLRQRIATAGSINAVTDLMLREETQTLLASLPETKREEIRAEAKARLVAHGWPEKNSKPRRQQPDEPDDPDTAGDLPAVQGAEGKVSRAPEPEASAPTSSDEPDPFGDLDDSLDGPEPFDAGAFLRDAERRFAEARTFAEIDEIVDATHEDSLLLDAVEIETLDGFRDAARERLQGAVKKIEPAPTDPFAVPERFKGDGDYQIWFRDAVTVASTDAEIRKVHAAWNATSTARKDLVASGQLVQTDINGLMEAFKAKRSAVSGATDQIAAYSAFLTEGLSKATTRDEADAFWRSTVAQRDGAGASEEVRAHWKRSWLDRKAGLAA